MKRFILFSTPTEMNKNKMLYLFFPDSIEEKVFAYMPSDGANTPKKYIEIAMQWAKTGNAEFLLINNALDGKDAKDEVRKLENANIL